MEKIYIICGHGEEDPGACAYGYTEAERVRTLAARIKALGGDAVTVGDTSIDWYKRNQIARGVIPSGVQVVELHMDSASASAKGGHVVIYGGYEPDAYDKALAQNIAAIFPGRAALITPRKDLQNPNVAARMGVSYRLLECCFISNRSDLDRFNAHMDEVARAILSAFGIGGKTAVASDMWVKDQWGWWYRHKDGSYKREDWEYISGKWYYFDKKGYAVHDRWVYYKGHWYYFKSDCSMATGWVKLSDGWYYLKTDEPSSRLYGSMVRGWQDIGGQRYYFATETKNGRVNGRMVTGWVYDGGAWYWCNKNLNCQPEGSMMRSHWIADGGKRYWLKDDGRMAAGEKLIIGGKEYAFSKSGACV